jgi:hypothetical protein
MIAAVVVAAVAGAVVSAYAVAHDRGNRAARAGSQVPAGANRCRAGQVAISLVRTGAVMGVEGGLLRFTNASPTSCRIGGWPTVTAVEAGGKTISSAHAGETMLFGWNGLAGRRLPMLRLAHGASAYAILAGGDTPLGRNPPPSCPAARRLVVTTPNTHGAVSLSGWLPNDVTDLPLCGRMTAVSPVLPLSAILH